MADFGIYPLNFTALALTAQLPLISRRLYIRVYPTGLCAEGLPLSVTYGAGRNEIRC